ncbi:hypothetical protein ANN_15352 [Periplaneta americana]|uniref:Uncharacterized protein n=1 Tax=Periplaneta americana TaxID=6978 RepID=A0ABQ8SI12_PERAM|nr:hypothetical protein ANN_15352 [Periplaneta americana]
MSPGSNTESYPAFAHLGLRENPGKNLNQVTCPDRESNPGHLVSRPDALIVTPQVVRGESLTRASTCSPHQAGVTGRGRRLALSAGPTARWRWDEDEDAQGIRGSPELRAPVYCGSLPESLPKVGYTTRKTTMKL